MTDAPMKAQFTATVALHGKTATGIEVPPEAVEALGPRKNPAVVITINAASFRTTIAKRGDRYLIPVSAENRTAVGVAADDQVEVQLALEGAKREETRRGRVESSVEALGEGRKQP